MTPLAFYTNILQQEHRRLYAHGSYQLHEVNMNMVPPFQVDVSKLVSDVQSVHIVNAATEVSTDITTEMRDSGLQVLQQDSTKSYNNLMYPSTVRLDIAEFEPGGYYLVIDDGVNDILYSEVFVMMNHIHRHNHIKVEWCHGRNLEYSGGHIQYLTDSGANNGYRNYLYLNTFMVKPRYTYTRKVSEKDGKVQPRKVIRKKVHRFELILPESLIDTVSIVELHDQIKLTDNYGNVLELDEFTMEDPRWFTQGNLAAVNINVVTETTSIVVVDGKGTAVPNCSVPDGICIAPTGSYYAVESDLIEGSINWVQGKYVNSEGVLTDLQNGNYVTAGGEGAKRLYRFVSPNNYTQIDLSGFYTKIYYRNTNEYWYDRGENLHIRTLVLRGFNPNTSPPTYYGRIMDDVIGELWLEDEGGARKFVQTATNSDLDLGVQVDDAGWKYVVLTASTVLCGVIMEAKKLIVPNVMVHSLADDDDSYILTLTDDDNSYVQSFEDLDDGPTP